MRYFKIFDDLAPEGDLYRVSEGDLVEFRKEDGSWKIGGWTGLADIQDYVNDFPGARLEFVDAP